MMTNLFSMFDPATNIFNMSLSLNWLSSLIPLIFIPLTFWMMPNNYMMVFNLIAKNLSKEFSMIIYKKSNYNFLLIINSLFLMILMNNFFGLFPYIFTSTSHLTFNLTLTLPLWLMLLTFGWFKKTNDMLIHLVPQGTPNNLIPFMICIETISILIRPITLTIRLTANMIAGHIILTLLGNIGPNMNNLLLPFLIIIQPLFLLLEMAVSIIQSYVFSILIILYTSEI